LPQVDVGRCPRTTKSAKVRHLLPGIVTLIALRRVLIWKFITGLSIGKTTTSSFAAAAV